MKNPLLEKTFNVPFDQIKVEHIKLAINILLKEAKKQLEDLVNSNLTERTFENTVLAYESITEKLQFANNIIEHLKSVDNSPELVEAHNEVDPKITEFSSNLSRHEGLYSLLKKYSQTEEAKNLKGAKKRFLKQILDDFVRSGAELDEGGKKRLSEIDIKLSKLASQFQQNLLDSTNAYSLVIEEENRLSGLPKREKEAAKERAKKKNVKGYLFNLQAPSVFPVLQYADERELRKEIYLAYNTRASKGEKDNREIIVEMLRLRDEKAKLLGYDNFADLILEDRMAKNGKTAKTFLREIKNKTTVHFEKENERLKQFYRELEGNDAPEMEPWDAGYYSEKQRKALFDFDSEELRPYFSFGKVLEGMFGLVNDLYGITVRPTDELQVWKGEGVQTYKVVDEDGTWLGSFYLDYFPREEKRDGAWMNFLYLGGPRKEGFQPHLGLNCGNLTPPTENKPALLSLSDVRTMFHEFGHLLHQILSTAEIRSQSGPQVAWDFVELPSQIMENWVGENEFLNRFAEHYETGEKIPSELLDKRKSAENYQAASFLMRQLAFSLMDLSLHVDYDLKKEGDVVEYCRKFVQDFSSFSLPEEYSMITSFHHLFGDSTGYAAAYYSYLWAEALEADAFSKFKKEGIFSRKVGTEFRQKILSKGDGKDPAKLYRDFMGRDPNPDALMIRKSLL